ncbi:MAG: YceI family protein [Candidatus Riflemargulisbacteria bacterium]
MNKFVIRSINNVLVVFLFSFLFATEYSYQNNANSKLWLEGDSTMHRFESFATALDVQLTIVNVDTNIKLEKKNPISFLKAKAPISLKISMPVNKLISPTLGLDGNLWGTLKADKYPNIKFELKDYSVGGTFVSGNETIYKVQTSGLLTIAGEQKVITMDGELRADSQSIWIEGKKRILMTDFNIKPPSILFVVNVNNEIDIFYKLQLDCTSVK